MELQGHEAEKVAAHTEVQTRVMTGQGGAVDGEGLQSGGEHQGRRDSTMRIDGVGDW